MSRSGELKGPFEFRHDDRVIVVGAADYNGSPPSTTSTRRLCRTLSSCSSSSTRAYRVGCGCRVEWNLVWKVLRRCKRHQVGAIPVRTMRRA